MPTIQESVDALVVETTGLTNTVSGRITDMTNKVAAADVAKGAAENAKSGAEIARGGAETAETAANTAKTLAQTAKTNAETASSSAASSSSAAGTSESNASSSATASANSATASASSASAASSSEGNALASKNTAEMKATQSAVSAADAATSATDATTNADTSATSAANAVLSSKLNRKVGVTELDRGFGYYDDAGAPGDLNWSVGTTDRGAVGVVGQNAFIISKRTDGVEFTAVEQGTEVFTIDDSGRVGLTNKNPTERLDVNGNIRTSGNLTVGAGLSSSDIYMSDSDHGARRIHCNSNNIGFLDSANNWGSYCTDNGDWITNGSLTVNANDNNSNIIMYDSDEGNRTIHCNSNRVGFLNTSGSWGSWCADNGDWHSTGALFGTTIYGSHLQINGGSLQGTDDATLSISRDGNQDWGLVIGSTNTDSDYGTKVKIAGTASYAFAVFNTTNNTYSYRVDGDGDVYCKTLNTVANGNIDTVIANAWTSGNDGAGSGLDADTLDGMQLGTLSRINYASSTEWDTPNIATSPYGGAFGFNNNSTIMHDKVPGGATGLVWDAIGDNAGTCNGGWGSKSLPGLNSKRSYMFTAMARRTTSSSSGTWYFGLQGNETMNMDGSLHGNPYFIARNIGELDVGVWYLYVGILHHDAVTGTTNGAGGLWNCSSGKKTATSTDFKWKPGSTLQSHRNFLCYSADGHLQFYDPGVYEINGTEPTVTELLQKGRSNDANIPNGVTVESAATQNSIITDASVATAVVWLEFNAQQDNPRVLINAVTGHSQRNDTDMTNQDVDPAAGIGWKTGGYSTLVTNYSAVHGDINSRENISSIGEFYVQDTTLLYGTSLSGGGSFRYEIKPVVFTGTKVLTGVSKGDLVTIALFCQSDSQLVWGRAVGNSVNDTMMSSISIVY